MKNMPQNISNSRVSFAARVGRNFAIVAALLAVFFLCNVPSNVYAATFVVNSTADVNDATAGNGVCETAAGNGVCTLRAAITEANALAGDDIITLPAGTYTQTLVGVDDANASGDLDITSNITINGAGSGTTFIEAATTAGTAVERVIHFPVANAIAVFNDVTIRNGRQTGAAFGGGVRVNAAGDNVTFNNCVISNNFSGYGGGGIIINNATASVILNNTTVTGNTAASTTSTNAGIGGGIFLNVVGAMLTATNSTISNNTTSSTTTGGARGGGISNGGTITLAGTTVSGNTVSSTAAAAQGGGIYNTGATVTLTNSTVSGNTATASSTFSTSGGGIAHFAGTMNITGSVVSTNSATVTGTGSGSGGGIVNQQATLTVTNSSVNNNAATFRGGVYTIASAAATTTINSSAIVNNGNGAGVTNLEGGGLGVISVGAANATLNLNNSTVGGNTINGTAAGIETFVTAAGNAITNINYSTVAGNAANVTNNANDFGGGIVNFGQQTTGAAGVSTVNLMSSIVADNSDGDPAFAPDIVGVITSLNYNHVENTMNGTFAPMANDVTGTDPGLTPLALNGGTTLNYKPGAMSPVLDTIPNGTNGCGIAPYNVDQRGVIRPTDSNNDAVAACEKGSVEVMAPTAAAVSVSGRVLGSVGKRGLANATVMMTDAGGAVRMARTNMFGYFQFDNVEAGQNCIFNVSAKRYNFQTQVVNVSDNLTSLNFAPLY